MKDQNEIASDLKGLINILNDGKVGFKDAVDHVESEELKSLFIDFSNQRAFFADELKTHLLQHGESSENEEGGVLGALHRTWLSVKEAFSSNEDSAILSSIITGEKAAVEKYDEVLEDYQDHADHYEMLSKQRAGISETLAKIEALHVAYEN